MSTPTCTCSLHLLCLLVRWLEHRFFSKLRQQQKSLLERASKMKFIYTHLPFIQFHKGLDWVQCSSAMNPLRCGHMVKIGHMLRSQQVQYTRTLDFDLANNKPSWQLYRTYIPSLSITFFLSWFYFYIPLYIGQQEFSPSCIPLLWNKPNCNFMCKS